MRGAIILLGLGIVAVCIFILPSGILTDQTGYYRPILIGMYLPAVPFFFALFQSLQLLSYIDHNKAFSFLAVKALKNIKYCAIIISALYVAGLPYIFTAADKDDAPGVVAIALVIIFASIVIAVFSGVLQSLLRNVIAIKSENDLTV